MLRFLAAALACAASLYGFETEESVHKSVPVSSATHLKLNADYGSIDVQPSAGRSVDVEVYFRGNPPSRREFDRMLRDFRLEAVQQGSEVTVNATFTHGWEPLLSFVFDGLFAGHAICRNWQCLVYSSWLDDIEFRVTVPRAFDTNLTTSGGSITVSRLKGEVIAHTSGGGITLTSTTGKAVVHTSGGGIRISETIGDVDATTSGGSISIDTVSGRVKAHTSGGGIDAREISGAIDVSTSGGSVTASLIAQPKQECRVYTAGGGISVSLPFDARVNLDASTSGGGVTTDFPVPYRDDRDRSQLRAPLNGGGPLFYLHTSGGGIHVKRTGAL